MPPDGPDRDDPIANPSSNIEFTHDVAFARPIKVFRDAPEDNATQMHVWSDGVREEMKLCVANQTEVRGWFAAHGDAVALQWPLAATAAHAVVINGDTVVARENSWRPPFYDQQSKDYIDTLLDPRVFHMGKVCLTFGDVIAHKKWSEVTRVSNPRDDTHGRNEWKQEVHCVPIRFLFLDTQYETVTLRTCFPESPQTEEIPINKFFADFPLSEQLGPRIIRRMVTLRSEEAREVFTPLPMAYSTATVVKALLKFRRLHLKAQEKKFAPGGLGFKRALETETAQAMKRACPAGPSGA